MPRWEYRMEVNLGADSVATGTVEELNSLGKEGWELVGVTEVTVRTGGSNVLFFLKHLVT